MLVTRVSMQAARRVRGVAVAQGARAFGKGKNEKSIPVDTPRFFIFHAPLPPPPLKP
jgi:hypothetical protein